MIDVDALRELLTYDKDTGIITWRVSPGRRASAGAEAGSKNGSGYLQIRVQHKRYKAHRIAWALAHGVWPTGEVDHIDGVRDNNRISNLRDVSRCTNMQNLKRAHRDNKSGSAVQGVSWDKRHARFRVEAETGGKKIHLGYFSILQDAEDASIAYRREHYPGFTL